MDFCLLTPTDRPTHTQTQPPQALDGPRGVLQGLEARMLGAMWQVYKDEAPHSGRSELLYGACVRACVCLESAWCS